MLFLFSCDRVAAEKALLAMMVVVVAVVPCVSPVLR